MRGAEWDYIVLGAGSAGCALAYELARSGSARVLILEAGGADKSLFIKVPAGQVYAIRRNDWGFTSQPDPSRNGKTDSWSRGRVLGGSSSVNGMMYVRGAAADFDRWAALGNRGWGYSDVLPLFRKMESSDQPGALRGSRGPLSIKTVGERHRLTDAFVDAAVASGWPFNPDYNGQTQEGVAYAQLSQRNGFRCSAAEAFLKPLRRRENLKVLLRSSVRRIQLRNARATGVSFVCDGVEQTAAARHIIVCAGALNSPKLLMLSGVGDPAELRRHGIFPQVSSPEVGRHLRDHPLVNLTYKMRVPSNNLTEGLLQKLAIAFQFLTRRTGPIANLFEATAFLRSTENLAEPDIQLHFLSMGYERASNGTIQPLKYPSVTVLLNKSHPESRGRVRLASSDPDAAPLIESRLLEAEADLETLVNGVAVVRKIMGTAPIARFIEKEMTPGVCSSSLREYIRNNTGISYHPVGTCRMGADANAVVTPELRVNGVENLWVADASVAPDLISGNTNALCMMVGKKLGQYLRRMDARGYS